LHAKSFAVLAARLPILVELDCSAEAVTQSAITIFDHGLFQRSALLSFGSPGVTYRPGALLLLTLLMNVLMVLCGERAW